MYPFFYFSLFPIFFSFFFLRATCAAYKSSQARGHIRTAATRFKPHPRPQPQQHQIQATSATYSTACSNMGSLTHWARPGIEPSSLWMLVGFLTHWATMGTPNLSVFKLGLNEEWKVMGKCDRTKGCELRVGNWGNSKACSLVFLCPSQR